MKAIFWLTLFGFGLYYGVKYSDKLSPFFSKSQNEITKKPRMDFSMGTN